MFLMAEGADVKPVQKVHDGALKKVILISDY